LRPSTLASSHRHHSASDNNFGQTTNPSTSVVDNIMIPSTAVDDMSEMLSMMSLEEVSGI